MLNKIRDAIANDNELSSESLRFGGVLKSMLFKHACN